MSFLTIQERQEFRHSIGEITRFNESLEKSLRRKQTIPLEVRQYVNAMTGCSDMTEGLDALLEIKEEVQGQYLKKLLTMAPKSLSAFAEYMNPDEPPAPHHEFLIDHLEAIEQGDLLRMLLSMPPGHAKPVDERELVMMGDGSFKQLKDVVPGDMVVTGNNRAMPVSQVHVQGELPIVEISTQSGRVLRTAADHPFLTVDGWKNAEDLEVYDTLVPAFADLEDSKTHTTEEFHFAGYACAFQTLDEEFRKGQVNFYYDGNCDKVCSAAIEAGRAANVGVEFAYRARRRNNANRIYIPLKDQDRFHELGLTEAIAKDTIPDWVTLGSPKQIHAFLTGFWKVSYCDKRSLSWTAQHRKRGLLFRTESMASSITQLMWRLGINAAYSERSYKKEVQARTGNAHYGAKMVKFNYHMWLDTFEAGKFIDSIRHTEEGHPIPSNKIAYIKGDTVNRVTKKRSSTKMRCLTVPVDNSFTIQGLVVHNSTYSSHLFPAWYLGRNPKRRYLQAGHTQKFCEDELGKKVRGYIRNERYADVFPEVGIAHDTSAAATWAIADFGGKYMTRAVGQGIAGLRGHIGGVDDPYPTYKEAESATYRQQVVDWFRADFSTRLLPNSPLFVVATRWHPEDLCGILEEESKKGKTFPYTVINLPAFCVDSETDPLNRPKGAVLWEYFDFSTLMNLKNSMSPKTWACLYQGNPIPESGNMLKPESIRRYSELPKGPYTTTFSCDTAAKATERSDYTVITIWRQYGNKHYLIDLVRERLDYNDFVKKVEVFSRKHHPDRILVEDAGFGMQYLQQVKNSSYEAPAPTVGVKTQGAGSKEFRFDAVIPMFESGLVYFPNDEDWLANLEKELYNFPSVSHDDQVDSVSMYLKNRRPKPQFGTSKVLKRNSDSLAEDLDRDPSLFVRKGAVDMSEAEDVDPTID